MLTVYGLKQCSTTQKAIKFLESGGRQVKELIDIRDTPPSKETIKLALLANDNKVSKIMNTSGGLYREMELKDKLPNMTLEEVIDLVNKNGMLIKRPLVTDFKHAAVSAKEDLLAKKWLS